MAGIVLIGQGPTAETAIESLAEKFSISVVFRRSASSEDAVVAYAERHSIPVVQDITLANVRAVLGELKPGCVVISSYDRVIPSDLVKQCPFINVHYSPLPRYRGRANVNWAIINGEPEAAITIHRVDDTLDSGNILFQQSVGIGPDSTITDLYQELNAIQRQVLGSTVASFLAGESGRAQEGVATYCCTRTPDDGEIRWEASTRTIYALIRSLAAPYPGAYSFYNLDRIVIVDAKPVSCPPNYVGRIPGRICAIDRVNGTVDVLTGDGVLRLCAVRTVDGVCSPAANVIRSLKDSLGLMPRDLLKRIAQLQESLDALLRASLPLAQGSVAESE